MLQFMGLQRVGHNLGAEQQQQNKRIFMSSVSQIIYKVLCIFFKIQIYYVPTLVTEQYLIRQNKSITDYVLGQRGNVKLP